MATQTVKYLLDIIQGLLQDAGYSQWPETDLIEYYNQAVLEIVSLNDSANPVEEPIKLAAGSKHYIPAQYLKTLDIISNMGTDGRTPGDAITATSKRCVEAFNRSWRTDTAAAAIVNWMPDEHDKKVFYTSPPADGTSYVLFKGSKIPDKVIYDDDGDWENAPVGVIDDFVEAVRDKIMEYCYTKDSDIPGNMQRESENNQQFMTELAARA